MASHIHADMVVSPTLSPTMPASLNAAPVTQPVAPIQPAVAKVSVIIIIV